MGQKSSANAFSRVATFWPFGPKRASVGHFRAFYHDTPALCISRYVQLVEISTIWNKYFSYASYLLFSDSWKKGIFFRRKTPPLGWNFLQNIFAPAGRSPLESVKNLKKVEKIYLFSLKFQIFVKIVFWRLQQPK